MRYQSLLEDSRRANCTLFDCKAVRPLCRRPRAQASIRAVAGACQTPSIDFLCRKTAAGRRRLLLDESYSDMYHP
jgi:hypothetical protein